MRWLIDFDSTLSDTHGEAIEKVNERFGTSYTQEDFHTWSTEQVLTPEQAAYMWGEEVFFNPEFQINVKPIPGAIEGVRKLLEKGHVPIVVTDRAEIIKQATLDWLEKHGLGHIPVHFTRSKESKTSNLIARTKAQVAWTSRLTHVVEDAPHHSLGLANRDYIKKVFLLDMPYNRHIEHPKIERIHSWEGVE